EAANISADLRGDLTDDFAARLPPVLRSLLRPAGMRRVEGILRAGIGEQLAVCVNRQAADAGGPQIEPEQSRQLGSTSRRRSTAPTPTRTAASGSWATCREYRLAILRASALQTGRSLVEIRAGDDRKGDAGSQHLNVDDVCTDPVYVCIG